MCCLDYMKYMLCVLQDENLECARSSSSLKVQDTFCSNSLEVFCVLLRLYEVFALYFAEVASI